LSPRLGCRQLDRLLDAPDCELREAAGLGDELERACFVEAEAQLVFG
jgi:hypothetical protein